MKRIVGISIVAALVVLVVSSFASAETGKFNLGYSGQALTGYVYNSGFKASNGAVWQDDIFLSYTTGNWGRVTLDFWNSAMFDGAFKDADGNEIDYTLSWDKDVAKNTNLKIGLMRIDCRPLLSGQKGDVNEIFFEIKHMFEINKENSLSPFFRLEWNQLIGPGQASSYAFIGTYHTWNIQSGLSLNEKFAAVIDDGRGSDGGVVGLYYGAMNWSLNNNFSIDAPIVKITIPIAGVADRNGSEIVGGAGINCAIDW